MILLDLDQRSPEWIALRLGRPTGSGASKLLTPATHKPSKQADAYRDELLAQHLIGYEEAIGSGWTDRGTGMEDEAVAFYELEHDTDIERVGFVLTDDLRFGGSPDGLVGDDGGLEIKCPAMRTHIGYLLGNALPYEPQCQAYMWLTGRAWWDVLVYSPALPAMNLRYHADAGWQDDFAAVLLPFLDQLDAAKAQLAAYRQPLALQMDELAARAIAQATERRVA